MTKKEFSVGDRVAWNYGIGKGKGHILEKVTKTTKFAGKNFKASPEEPKYLIKSDKGKELLRNPETLEMLLKEDVGDDNGDVEEMDHEAEDAQEVAHEKDDDPTADIEGTEKKEEVKEALASQDRELEAKAAEVSNKEDELGGEPLQQMPGAEKNVLSTEDKDDSADLSKVEAQPDPAGKEPVHDVKMDEAKEKPSNGTTAATEADAPRGLPHETVPQPDLDAVK